MTSIRPLTTRPLTTDYLFYLIISSQKFGQREIKIFIISSQKFYNIGHRTYKVCIEVRDSENYCLVKLTQTNPFSAASP